MKKCKIKKDHVTFLEEEYNRLKKLVSSQKDKNTGNTINYNTTNNNTQNINITLNAYGQENLSFLTEENVRNLLMETMAQEVIPKLIKKIHCNPNHPENMNVYKPNKKDQFLMLFNGKNWMMECMEKVIGRMIDQKAIMLDKIVFGMPTNEKEDTKMVKVQETITDDEYKKNMEKFIASIYIIILNL